MIRARSPNLGDAGELAARHRGNEEVSHLARDVPEEPED
jgi:hypothetical protein